MPQDRLRILIWAGYPALRAGLSELVREGGFTVAAELSSVAGVEATDVAADVLVADIDGREAERDVRHLADLFALPAVFMAPSDATPRIGMRDIEAGEAWISREASGAELSAAIQAAAAGFLVLDPAFAPAVVEEPARDAADGAAPTTPLTACELDVLRWLAVGLPNKAIALTLGISEHTVKFHVGSVLAKLDARSRTEAVTTAARAGLLTL